MTAAPHSAPRFCVWLTALLLLTLPATSILAADSVLSGERHIYLLDSKGMEHPIGSIRFSDKEGKTTYHLDLDHHRFTDHFLSMKEMKCLEGKELWCYVPYPYDNPHRITPTDLRWLEHDLLFLFKRNAEFGANFWNGIYYQLQFDGKQLKGTAQALDLNLLASPPDDQSSPPIGEFDIDEADLEERWLPHLIIR